MTVTALARNFDGNPNIVTMVTTSSNTDITTAGWFTLPSTVADIELLQNGDFQTAVTDLWLIYYATGIGFYTLDPSTNAFVALSGNAGLSTTLSNGNIFVGNASNVATGVAVSGILAITNAGVTSIPLPSAEILVGTGGGVAAPVAVSGIVSLSNAGVTSIPLTSAHILVGSAGNAAASVALSGDATISNAGVLTIGAGAVTQSKIANNAVDYAQLALDVAATATVTLTAAQINGMYATPVQILAAQGAGKLILIDSILWDIAFVSAQYASGGAIQAQYGNTVHGAGSPASASIAAATLNGVAASGFIANGSGSATLNAPATVENTAVFLSNATGPFTTGDSTVTLYIRYRVVTPA